MNRSSLTSLLRICLLLTALVAQCAFGQDQRESREILAERILNNPAAQLENKEIEQAMTNATARPLFKQLRSDKAWGPEHPTWKRLFSEFCVSFTAMTDGLTPDMGGRLKLALVNNLTENELAEIVATQNDGKMNDVRLLMKEVGMDIASIHQLVGMTTNPGLYSQAEKEIMRTRLAKFKEHESEMKALNRRLDDAMRPFKTPAFTKYLRIFPEVLQQSLKRLESDELAKQRLQAFASTWRGNVTRD